jgi:hypothetical protein
MKDSMTYQKILADGREEGIAQGKAAGVTVGEQALATIEAASGAAIEHWAEDLHGVESWIELVQPCKVPTAFCSRTTRLDMTELSRPSEL